MEQFSNFDTNDDFRQKSNPVFTAKMQELIIQHWKELLSFAYWLLKSSSINAEDFLNDFIAYLLISIQDKFDENLLFLPWAKTCMQNYFYSLCRKSNSKKYIKYVSDSEGKIDKISDNRNPLEILEGNERTKLENQKLEEAKKGLSKKDLEIFLNLMDGTDFDALGQIYFPNAKDPNRTARQAKCRILEKLNKLLKS